MQRGTYDVSREEEPRKPSRWDKFKDWRVEVAQKFRLILHNPETGEYLTRTPRSWGEIGLFYLVFYTCLAAFFAICMAVFLRYEVPSQEEGPKFTDVICSEPGWKKAGSKEFLFTVVAGTPPEKEKYDNQAKAFVTRAGYNESQQSQLIQSSGRNLSFPDLTSCNGPSFGESGEPCVYFRLNRIAGYVAPDDVRIECTVENAGSSNLFEEFKDQPNPLDTNPSTPLGERPLVISPHPLPGSMTAYDPSDQSYRSPLFIGKFYLGTTFWNLRNSTGQSRKVALVCNPVLNSSGHRLSSETDPIQFSVVFRTLE